MDRENADSDHLKNEKTEEKTVDKESTQSAANQENEEIELLEDEEIVVEETFIQVSMDNPNDMPIFNVNTNARLMAVDSDSPTLQIENKVNKLNFGSYVSTHNAYFCVFTFLFVSSNNLGALTLVYADVKMKACSNIILKTN